MVNKYYMYVLLCGDNSLYGGFTNNLQQRLLKHQSGKGAKYTRSHLPVKMIYYESFENKGDALKAEYAFKHQPRSQKIKYLLNNGVNGKLFR
ncbi:GIY-YIG nuclease family protein [Apilactobacillus micheneri]|uniref:GIY-YIG nuclease family protein n=1 Tax=Apilactobacillus micheneri TaxID=1899430 RepID=UPI000D51BCFC|nr:GIY-YIG nuclease family protein [Apilactobacillus micheneri]GAY79266.1 hypothetical protein NBRC113063_00100 [Apilactobacillus micheneri]